MMRYTLAGVAVALALCGCGRGRASQQETPAVSATDTAEELRIVGCLVPSGETPESHAVGTSGHLAPPTFTLVNVTTSVAGSTARSFGLVADKGRLEDLQRFANSRVEVSGFVVSSTGNGVSDGGAVSAPFGAPPTDVRRIRVKDVRQLESTCGEPKKE
jgi:hypothetical protein